MSRYFLSTFLLMFFPAFSQVKSPIQKMKRDTTILLHQIEQIHTENARLVDSIAAIVERRDSIQRSRHGVFVRVYNVDHPDGKRQVWTWVYDIKGRDTIFNRVEKKWTRWDK